MRYRSLRESLEHVRAQYRERCTHCGLCVEVCPVYQVGEWQSMAPDKLHEERMAATSDGTASQAAYNFTFACSNCATCRGSCPEGLDPFEFTRLMRMAVVDGGRPAPPNAITRLPNNRQSLLQIAKALQVKPGTERWITVVPESPPQADFVLFLGCNILMMPDKVDTILDILAKVGLNVPVVGGTELCCGEVDLLAGDPDAADRLLRGLVEALARFHPKEVILWCGGCYSKLFHTAPDLVDVPFRCRHLSSFLLDHLDKLSFQQPVKATVAIHDPCTLGRVMGEYEPVRQLLRAIPGLQLVEMAKCRGDAGCCGSTSHGTAPELATALMQRVLREAAATGATRLATICQGCQRRFGREEVNHSFRVESFITLVGEALGIRHDDRLKRYAQYRDPDRVIAECEPFIAASDYPRDELERLVRQYFA
jgi:Fe-S oxidoreductase